MIEAASAAFRIFPLSFLEVWGAFAFAVGLLLAACAFGGLTFRPQGRWGIGRDAIALDAPALRNLVLTIVLVMGAGYLGSFVVLVPGAQTLESLKDAMVFVCVVLFGYPALIGSVIAYVLSDLIEGVAPHLMWHWGIAFLTIPGYHWIAWQLIGRDPDFRRLRTWASYGLFVLLFQLLYPPLWGYALAQFSGVFTPVVAYYQITPALFLTLVLSWLLAPLLMLGALPLARRFGLLRPLASAPGAGGDRPLPVVLMFVAPFVLLIMATVGIVAFLSLRSGEDAAHRLAERLHREISANITLQLEALPAAALANVPARRQTLEGLLGKADLARTGRAVITDRDGRVLASSHAGAAAGDAVAGAALHALQRHRGGLAGITAPTLFRFDVETTAPLARTTWLAQVDRYRSADGARDWRLLTALPESDYLQELQRANSKVALVVTIALIAAMMLILLLVDQITRPLRRFAESAQALARGDLTQRVPPNRLDELDTLSSSLNHMAGQLQHAFADAQQSAQTVRDMLEKNRRISERLQLATRAAGLGVWDWDVAQNTLVWDDGMYRLYGRQREQFPALIEAWSAVLDPDDRARVLERLQASLREVGDFVEEFRIHWPDGSVRVIGAVGRTFADDGGRPARMVGINYDITERKLAEQELRQHREQLEDTVRARTRELEVARNHAEAANRSKSAFLANMSHEIRTPMNAVLGYNQLILQLPGLPATARDYLGIIDKSGAHLLRLINDVLEMSKIEAANITLTRSSFDPRDLLSEIGAMLRERAEHKGIGLHFRIDPELPATLSLDLHKLRQVLINVIGNAIKFTDRGHVEVIAAATPASGGALMLAVTVKDTGQGISADEIDLVFAAFEQTASGRAKGGTGLGMPISRQYARAMGGDITIASAPGQGATVRCEFLAQPGERQTAAPSQGLRMTGVRDGARMPRILVVDDIASNRDVMSLMLADMGLSDVVSAASGAEAVAAASAGWQPDVVFMDWRMPSMDGLQATAAIHALPGLAAVPVAMVSASVLAEERRQAAAIGVQAFIRKPYRESDLADALQQLLPGVPFTFEQAHVQAAPPPPDYHPDADRIDPLVRGQLVRLIEIGDIAAFRELAASALGESSPALHQHLADLAGSYHFARMLAVLAPGHRMAVKPSGAR